MALPPHIPIAVKMMPHLVECAKAGRMTTYEEIGEAIQSSNRLFSRPLAFIRDFICAGHNLPPLTVIVQRKGTETVSTSFDPVQFTALSSKDYKALQEEMIKAVHAYPNWDRACSGTIEMFKV